MSPSEADLRAFLREGEGDHVDPEDIIWSGRQVRARRRTLLLSAAAAVVVVGATATGVAALVNSPSPSANGGGNGTAAQASVNGANNAAGGSPGHRALVRVPDRARAGGPGVAGAAPSCLRRSGSRALVHGAHASGPLLAGPVKKFVVCAYSNGTLLKRMTPQPVVVTGPAARQLASSLRHLSATMPPRDCPMIAATASTAVRIVPITATGRQLASLVANIGLPTCETVVTNGSAVRYGWHVPPRVAALLRLGERAPGLVGGLVPPTRRQSGTPPR